MLPDTIYSSLNTKCDIKKIMYTAIKGSIGSLDPCGGGLQAVPNRRYPRSEPSAILCYKSPKPITCIL